MKTFSVDRKFYDEDIIRDVILFNGTSAVTPSQAIGSSTTFTPSQDADITGVRATTYVGTTLDTTIYPYITDTDNHDWQEFGTVKEITWSDEAGTVYGGTIAYLGGDAWRLTKTMESVDMGTLSWIKSSSGNNFYASVSPRYDYGVNVPMLCSQYVNAGARGSLPYYGNDKEFTYFLRSLPPSPAEIYVHDEAYSDAATFTTAVTGQQLVYKLATPVTYDLTGEELATVLGNNNVFSSTGDVTELTYRADTGLFVRKLLTN